MYIFDVNASNRNLTKVIDASVGDRGEAEWHRKLSKVIEAFFGNRGEAKG